MAVQPSQTNEMTRIMNRFREQEDQIREQNEQINRLHKGQKQLRTELECNISKVQQNITTISFKEKSLQGETAQIQDTIMIEQHWKLVMLLFQKQLTIWPSQMPTDQQADTSSGLADALQQMRSQTDHLQETEQVELDQLAINSTTLQKYARVIIQAVGSQIKTGSYLNLGEQDVVHKLLNLASEQIHAAAQIGIVRTLRKAEMEDVDMLQLQKSWTCGT